MSEFLKDTISVIVPIYNVEDYLRRCVNSIIRNSYKMLEVILIDDGSTDRSGEIADQYALTDSRIKVIHQKNCGLSAARNAGMDAATGEFITFIDSDDWISDDFFMSMIEAYEKCPADIIMCDFSMVSSEEAFIKDINPAKYQEISFKEMMMNHRFKSFIWRRLIKHSLIKNMRFKPVAVEDAEFILQMISGETVPTITCVNKKMYAYYRRSGSLSSYLKAAAFKECAFSHLPYINNTNTEVSELIALEMVKKALSSRYQYRVVKDQDNVKELNACLRMGFVKLNNKEKLKYLILILFPDIYRMIRIHADPSLLVYEKQLKEKRSEL